MRVANLKMSVRSRATGISDPGYNCRIDCRLEDLAHFAFQAQRDAMLMVVIGRSAIDDDVRSAFARGQKRK